HQGKTPGGVLSCQTAARVTRHQSKLSKCDHQPVPTHGRQPICHQVKRWASLRTDRLSIVSDCCHSYRFARCAPFRKRNLRKLSSLNLSKKSPAQRRYACRKLTASRHFHSP